MYAIALLFYVYIFKYPRVTLCIVVYYFLFDGLSGFFFALAWKLVLLFSMYPCDFLYTLYHYAFKWAICVHCLCIIAGSVYAYLWIYNSQSCLCLLYVTCKLPLLDTTIAAHVYALVYCYRTCTVIFYYVRVTRNMSFAASAYILTRPKRKDMHWIVI